MIIGTAGHVDHGKTSLVKALTGVDTDRLKEEKLRGISIDLGFAFLAAGPDDTLSFIDVPGHERFVHTMVAGASGIDLALLVVAADDGLMPQTLEHLAILDLLGVRRAMVVVTKIDLVTELRAREVAEQAKALVFRTGLACTNSVSVSAMTGRGMDTLVNGLVGMAREPSTRPVDGPFRLPVDRVFTLPGIGVVVTGTVLSGVVRVDDRLCVSPSGLPVRVRSVHAQNRAAESARAGDRCALNLAGPGVSKEAIRRGDVVLEPSLHAPTDRIDAHVTLLGSERKAIGQWSSLRLHHASAELGGHLVLLDEDHLAPGACATVQLVLDKPIAATALDRFIMRDGAARRTIGGGQFIDLRPPARRRRTTERRLQLAALTIQNPILAFKELLEIAPHAWDLTSFVRDRAISPTTAAKIQEEAPSILLAESSEQMLIGSGYWRQFCEALIAKLSDYHQEHPDEQGIGRDRLRMSLRPTLSTRAFAAALAHESLAALVAREGGFVRLTSHTSRPTPHDEEIWARLAGLLDGEVRFRPPRVRDLAGALGQPEQEVRRILKAVSRLGRVDQVAHDHFFLRATVAEMISITANIAAGSPQDSFVVAQVRDRLGNGRKVTIQILEFFDRLGITKQFGDQRRLQRERLGYFVPETLA